MAPKDYVSRGRAKKAKAPEPTTPLPWLRIGITLALVAGFAAFLWSIKDRAETAPSQSADQPRVEEALPEIPEEEWEFMTLLPDTTVEVEVPEEEASDVRYLMQCGSFRTLQQAEAMKAKIAFQGLESQIKASNGKNGLWHRVVLGPYETKRSAERDRHKLQRSSITTCRIWLWN